ncbi:MAG TPA: O-antigen ligase family protein [Thermovirgaceae bacterium]|nr:O-antigen ligase family protein [Thermovirgaceae bacterium]
MTRGKAEEPVTGDMFSLNNGTVVTGLLAVALVLPNLLFSGTWWYESLHIIKWAAVFIPVGLLVFAAGYRIASGRGRDPVLDPFGVVWLFLVLLLLMQPLWAPVRSIPTFAREWFFFAALWGVYVVSRGGLKKGSLSLFLWGASFNGAINVLFAEIQIRGLQGIFPFIYPVSGLYIGNTGQQNMFGLWLAIAMFGSASLFYNTADKGQGKNSLPLAVILNLLLFSICSWGLWNTTSRSAVLSFLVGLVVMTFLAVRNSNRRAILLRLAALAAIMAVTFSGTAYLGRGNAFIMKTRDMIENFQTVGKRDSIWAASGTMFLMHPVRGVGLGHFKWNYLEAQREMLLRHPGMKWQYTYWAHNEILQWFCETGIVGGLILLAMGVWWLSAFFSHVRKGKPLSREAMWACSFLFLIWFNALWTRPFHRIEDAVWMALAFALANREILPSRAEWTEIRRGWVLRGLGVAMAAGALSGLFFLGSGMAGDRILRVAASEKSMPEQRLLLERASRRLMVSDIAERRLALHYIRLAEETKMGQYLDEGLTRLHLYFLRQPHVRDMIRLIAWYSDVGEAGLMESVARYLRPGSYTITGGKINLSSEDERRFFGQSDNQYTR